MKAGQRDQLLRLVREIDQASAERERARAARAAGGSEEAYEDARRRHDAAWAALGTYTHETEDK